MEITRIGFHFHGISLKIFKKDTNEKGRGRDGVVEGTITVSVTIFAAKIQSLLQKGNLLSARTPPFTKQRWRPLCHTFISRKDGKCDISYCHIHFEFTSNPTSQQ